MLVIRGGFIGGFYVNVLDDCCLESTKKNGNSELCCIQFIPLDFQLAFYPALLAVLFLRV